MPTETVYGLAARIDLPQGIERIFTTKQRPFFDPLIVHVSSIDQAKTLTTQWSRAAQALAAKFWPGPLTLVLPKSDLVQSMITSGLDSVGIRMPSHPLALTLIQEVGVPLAAPSANKFGRTSPTTAAHVASEFKDEDVFVVDGGECQVGIESTVLMVKEDSAGTAQVSILRKGHILRSEVEDVLTAAGIEFQYIENVSKKESPGHMKHHYMPALPLILVQSNSLSESQIIEEAQRALKSMPDVVEDVKIIKPLNGIRSAIQMKLSADPVLASRQLYAQMRECAESGADLIYVYLDKDCLQGTAKERWEGLVDRLQKAASLILH